MTESKKTLRPSWLSKNQARILLLAFFTPILAVTIGDYHGAANWQDTPYGIASDLYTGAGAGLVCLAVFLIIIGICNFISNRHEGSNILWNVRKVLYVIGYLLIAFVAWIAYGLYYSLHDPTTE